MQRHGNRGARAVNLGVSNLPGADEIHGAGQAGSCSQTRTCMMCSPAKEMTSQTVRITSMEADSVRRTRFAVHHLETRTSHLPLGGFPFLCIPRTRPAGIWSFKSCHMPLSVITAPPEPVSYPLAVMDHGPPCHQIFTVHIPKVGQIEAGD